MIVVPLFHQLSVLLQYFYLKYKLEEEEEMKNKFKIDYEKRKNKIDIFEDRLVTLDELLKFT